MITKPIIDDSYVWASAADPVQDIIIPEEQLNTGWGYADKPAYQYFNWYWNQTTAFLVHINQNGIPEWDTNSIYYSSGYSKFGADVYQAFSYNYGYQPDEHPRIWKPQEYMAGLKDVAVDINQHDDLIVNHEGAWMNMTVRDALKRDVNNFLLGDLQNVTISSSPEQPYPESIIIANSTSHNNPDSWINQDLRAALQEKVGLADCNDTQILNPVENEVLMYKKVPVEYLGEIREEMRWVNSPYTGRINWYNISNKPEEFNPVIATEDTYGGMIIHESGGNLIIETIENRFTEAPQSLSTQTISSTELILRWSGSSAADQYAIFEDDVEIDRIGSGQLTYSRQPGDNNYHVYYIKAVNTNGDLSYASNYQLGIAK